MTDIFLIDQELVDGPPRPRAAAIRRNTARVEPCCDLGFILMLIDKAAINVPDDRNLVLGAEYQDDAVRLNALVLPEMELTF